MMLTNEWLNIDNGNHLNVLLSIELKVILGTEICSSYMK